MKKGLGAYIIIWLLLVSLFNVICFVTPDTIGGYEKFGGAFWSGYIFIMAAFVIHLAFSFVTISAEGYKKRALNMPLNIIAWAELLVMLVAGSLCMVIPNLPNWFGIVLCYAILVFSIILVITAKTVDDKTDSANTELNNKIAVIRKLTGAAAELKLMAKTPEAKQLANKIYEALRYTDPVSSPATAEIESSIAVKLGELSAIIGSDDADIKTKAEELLLLIEKRANDCKAAK